MRTVNFVSRKGAKTQRMHLVFFFASLRLCVRLFALILLASLSVSAQQLNPTLLSSPWKSMWITGPGEQVQIWSGGISGITESTCRVQIQKDV